MTDTTAGEMPPELVPPMPPASDAAPEAVVAAAAPDLVAPEADTSAAAPELALPNGGSTSAAILDHFTDSVEGGDQTIGQIIAGLGGTVSRNTIESAVRRLHESGRLLRTAPGTYRLAPPRPPEASKPAPSSEPEPVRSDQLSDAQWLDALERFFENPESWDVEKLGPGPDVLDNKIPHSVKVRMNDRLRKREERRRDREAAAAKQAEADAELRAKLLAAANCNFQAGPGLDDMTVIHEVLKTVPVDRVVMTIKQTVDKRCYPGNPPLVSWRDPVFLRAVAQNFCQVLVIPGLVKEWSAAGAFVAILADDNFGGNG